MRNPVEVHDFLGPNGAGGAVPVDPVDPVAELVLAAVAALLTVAAWWRFRGRDIG